MKLKMKMIETKRNARVRDLKIQTDRQTERKTDSEQIEIKNSGKKKLTTKNQKGKNHLKTVGFDCLNRFYYPLSQFFN